MEKDNIEAVIDNIIDEFAVRFHDDFWNCISDEHDYHSLDEAVVYIRHSINKVIDIVNNK